MIYEMKLNENAFLNIKNGEKNLSLDYLMKDEKI